MILYRIASTGPTWPPQAIDGVAASMNPGRWNQVGEKVIYASPTRALAALETAAHINDTGLPLNRFLIEIDVPSSVWTARHTLMAATLPVGWDAIPQGVVSVSAGAAWYAARASALLEVPSVIVAEEFNVLINANHADASLIRATAIRPFQYNSLFRSK